jgi:hypothetical protein
VGLAVARAGGDQRRLGPAARRLALGLGGRRPGDQEQRRDDGDRHAERGCGIDFLSHCLSLLE